MKNRLLAVNTICLPAILLAPAAFAGTVTTNFNVKITVTASCTIGAASLLDFGSVAGTAAGPSALGTTFNVTCTYSTPYDVSFAGSNDLSDVDKQMAGPAGNFVKYAITSDPAGINKLGKTFGSPAGTGGTGIDGVGTGVAIPTTVYASINLLGWTSIAHTPGVYTDTVTVTVNF